MTTRNLILAGVLVLTPTVAIAQNAAPKTVTMDGITLRINSAGWKPFNEFAPRSWYGGTPKPPLLFVVDFALEGVPPGPRVGRFPSVPENSVRAFIVTPNGARLQGELAGPNRRVWNTPSSAYQIDPRWENLSLEFEWRAPDPNAGRPPLVRERVEWPDLPLPPETADAKAEPQAMNLPDADKITTSGFRVRLESGLVRVAADGVKVVHYVGRWLPPLNDPGRCAEADLDRGTPGERAPSVVFDNGAPQEDNNHHVGIGTGRNLTKHEDAPGYFHVYAPLLEGAKSTTLRVEIMPQRILNAPSRLFRLTLPMKEMQSNSAALPAMPAPIAEAKLGEGTLKLYPLGFSPENGYKWGWRGQLIMENPAPLSASRRWVMPFISYVTPTNSSSTGPGSDMPWQQNGAPLGANQLSYQITPRWSEAAGQAMPAKIDLQMDWQEMASDQFELAFKALPIPAPGKIIELNQTQNAGEWGDFSVKKVAWFDEANTFSPRLRETAKLFQPPLGLAVVLEHTPKQAVPGFVWNLERNDASWSLRSLSASDSNGRSLLRVCDVPEGRHFPSSDDLLPDAAVGDRAAIGTPPYRVTLYFLPPAPDAKTWNFTIEARHTAVLRRQKVTMSGVPLSAPAP